MVNFGRNAKESIKQFFVPDTMIFEQLGIICTPPIDGHNIADLKDFIRMALNSSGPVLVHVVTKKGIGYAPAQEDPERFHGVGPFDIATGGSARKIAGPPTYTEVFGKALIREARVDEHIVAITAGMKSGTGLTEFGKEFPDRFIDVGIAEENAVGMAAGLAIGGCKPVVAIYSTFLQRAIDQIIVDDALAKQSVVFAIDRAGIVGADGPTHQGLYDIAYCSMIPNMRMMAPSNENELASALHTALRIGGPVAVRYPRGEGLGVRMETPTLWEVGKSRTLKQGSDGAILAFGDRVAPALDAAQLLEDEGVSVSVVDMRWIKPLDIEAIEQAAKTGAIVTVENGILSGGAGSHVAEVLTKKKLSVPLSLLGVDDKIVPHGNTSLLLEQLGIDASGIARAMKELIGK